MNAKKNARYDVSEARATAFIEVRMTHQARAPWLVPNPTADVASIGLALWLSAPVNPTTVMAP